MTALCEIPGCLEVVGGCAIAETSRKFDMEEPDCRGCHADHLCAKHYCGLLHILNRKNRIHGTVRGQMRVMILNETETAKVLNWNKEWERSRRQQRREVAHGLEA